MGAEESGLLTIERAVWWAEALLGRPYAFPPIESDRELVNRAFLVGE